MKTFKVVDLYSDDVWTVQHYSAQDAVYSVAIDILGLNLSDVVEFNGKYSFGIGNKESVSTPIALSTLWKGF